MKHHQMQKVVPITVPVVINDNTAYTTAEIDTVDAALGKANYLSVYVMFGVMDIAVAVLKLQESDVSGSGFVDITGADFSVSPATLPSATADGLLFAIHVDLRGRKRFFDLSFTAGDGAAGTYAVAWAVLSEFSTAPSTAALRGFSQELVV